MQIGVLGINHKLATLALRESLVRTTFSRLKKEYIYLATCNRVEIYFSSNDLAATHSHLLQLLIEEIEEEVAHKLYSYFGEDCFLHLARVTAGLDSAVLFETEIQGQVKRAYQNTCAERKLSSEMHFLFQKSLAIGKRVRTLFPANKEMPSLEETIVRVTRSLLGPLGNKRVLFVGVSEINRKIAHYLKKEGVREILFCNRSVDKGCNTQELSYLSNWHRYDVTIFGTSAPHYLLEGGRSPTEKRLVLDLSVPRNVDPAMGKLANVTLLNVDQLQKIVNRRHRGRSKRLLRLESAEVARMVMRQRELYRRRHLPKLALVG